MKEGTSQRLLTANEQVWRVWGVRVVVFKTSLSTIYPLYRADSWWSVLLVEETGENLLQVTDKLNHIMLYRVHLA